MIARHRNGDESRRSGSVAGQDPLPGADTDEPPDGAVRGVRAGVDRAAGRAAAPLHRLARTAPRPSVRLKSPTIGIEPPEPIWTGSLPHSAASAVRAFASAGMS